MSNLTTALIVVMSINLMLFLGQAAVLNINPEGPHFFDCKGSMIGSLDQNGCNGQSYVLNDTDPANRLPSGVSSVSPETGNIFTDPFTTLKSWFLDTLGLRYLVQLLSAPMNFLSAIGLPNAFAFAVGALWYGITLFLIVAFLIGRDA